MIRRAALLALAALPAAAQPAFIEVPPAEGERAVALAVAQVVRVGRLQTVTVIDTMSYVQLQTRESAESIARRLAAAGLALAPLTDLAGARTWVAVDRVVSIRPADARHAPGARTSLIMSGLRFTTDFAVREPMEEVMASLRRAGAGP